MSYLLFSAGGVGFVVPRIILGILFLVHGWSKVRDLRQNARNFSGMGFKPGVLWGTIAALLEFFGGIGIILGIWMPYLCFLFICEFIVIIVWKLAKKMPFVGGFELDLLIFAMLLTYFTLYGGFSVVVGSGL
jgi:putative oxidoreductase